VYSSGATSVKFEGTLSPENSDDELDVLLVGEGEEEEGGDGQSTSGLSTAAKLRRQRSSSSPSRRRTSSGAGSISLASSSSAGGAAAAAGGGLRRSSSIGESGELLVDVIEQEVLDALSAHDSVHGGGGAGAAGVVRFQEHGQGGDGDGSVMTAEEYEDEEFHRRPKIIQVCKAVLFYFSAHIILPSLLN
jgi:hypothetical protein